MGRAMAIALVFTPRLTIAGKSDKNKSGAAMATASFEQSHDHSEDMRAARDRTPTVVPDRA
jgi:hypothetical protein